MSYTPFIVFSFSALAQPVGSGGVNDLSAHRFWYAAEDLNLNNLDPVTQWNNLGGNPEDLT